MTTRITQTRTVHAGWTTLMIATLQDGRGQTFEREIEDHGRAAAVLPYDPARRTVSLVRVVRAPVLFKDKANPTGELWEAPAGMMDEDDPAETVRREAMEEAGLRLGALEAVATVWSSPGVCAERVALFLAPYAESDRVAKGGGLDEEHEGITVVEMPIAELWRLVEAGEVTDLKTFALAQALRIRHPELF